MRHVNKYIYLFYPQLLNPKTIFPSELIYCKRTTQEAITQKLMDSPRS